MTDRTPIKNRGDWLAMRRRDVTSSDIGALFGLHPYRSQLQVYADKTGHGVSRGSNSSMRRGRIMEAGVSTAVREEKPTWSILKVDEYLRDAEEKIGATPDFYIRDSDRPEMGDGVLETKTAEPHIFERDWANGPPLAWQLQCLTAMMLLDAKWGAIAVLVMSRDLPVFIYDVPRHAAAEDKIRSKVREFWKNVESGEPPKAEYTKDAEAIAAMFPRERGNAIDLSASNRLPVILERRSEIAAQIKAAECEKDAIDAEIKEAIGEAPEASIPGWRLTYRTQHRKETIIPARDFRVLRVTDLRRKMLNDQAQLDAQIKTAELERRYEQ